jgi:transcriptional regulator with XRE-family HTH domain
VLRKTNSPPNTAAPMLTPEQLRAARALVDWSRDDLAKRSGVSPNTVWGFEQGHSDPKLSTLNKWQRALEAAGVLFLDEDDTVGPGVRLKESSKRQRRR